MQGSDEPQATTARTQAATLGRPLDDLSVSDLQDYVVSLRSEISRVEHAIGARKGVRSAADAIFGSRARS